MQLRDRSTHALHGVWKRHGVRVHVLIRCVAIDSTQITRNTEVLMIKSHDKVMTMAQNATVTMDMHTPFTPGLEIDAIL